VLYNVSVWIEFHKLLIVEFWLIHEITNGMRSGRSIPQDSEFLSLTLAPTPLEWPSQEEPRSGLTASDRRRTFPLLLVQVRHGLLCGPWVWRRTSRRPCCPPISNPSTSPWAACRAGLRGRNGGNCPGPSVPRVPPVMTFLCFE